MRFSGWASVKQRYGRRYESIRQTFTATSKIDLRSRERIHAEIILAVGFRFPIVSVQAVSGVNYNRPDVIQDSGKCFIISFSDNTLQTLALFTLEHDLKFNCPS